MIDFFGLIITTRGQVEAQIDAVVTAANQLTVQAREECDFWKAKYFYAKARAVVAERFRNPVIKVTPHFVHDLEMETVIKYVEVEVGHPPATEEHEDRS